ncbi:N-6 DNA methylase [Streptomyces sp. NPDC094143]|uniref:Eco57I restriction-modification methylase domain-containing protein n=1 Tax=Streptomyces sp. NPDC094143 TaxID=3155310 RepID=UPI003331E59B
MTSKMRQLPNPSAIPAESINHGEVYTQRWVVDLILDLVGYTPDRDLSEVVITDPACGGGAFLVGITERLSESCRKFGRELPSDGIRAFDILARNVSSSREKICSILTADGWEQGGAEILAEKWITQGDYLLSDITPADIVIGNPPYIRLEDVPADRMQSYRARNLTMTGRSDIYVGFFERGLESLKEGGALGFICADRWMRNQYGRELRKLIASRFSVDSVIVMHDVDAFEDRVAAYPAVTIIRNSPQSDTMVADTSKELGPKQARRLLSWLQKREPTEVTEVGFTAARLPHWFSGDESWPTGSPARLALLEHLNDAFPVLEETDTKVGIGVATGADSVFLTTDANLVESDRLLPLSMVKDARSGVFDWTGSYLVNPWTADGDLVSLDSYPRLNSYLQKNRGLLSRRHVAKKRPDQWYRTIDKVDASLVGKPKLLLPDMRLTIHPTLEQGGHYPHHNLYYVTSESWDLEVLGGLLLSRVAQLFVESYAVRMRGGTLRFQAQYLRRIRVPQPDSLSERNRRDLIAAFRSRDVEAATSAALRAYGILTSLPK